MTCKCGCGLEAPPGATFASGACRSRHWHQRHPKVDLGNVPPEEAARARRLIEEATRAAKLGLERATIDSRFPVHHERDPRPSCRPRLDTETWEALEWLKLHDAAASLSAVVRRLVREEVERRQGELRDWNPSRRSA